MKTTILFKGQTITREVDLSINYKGFIAGSVGSAKIYWDKFTYDVPLVHFPNGKKYSDAEMKEFLKVIVLLVEEYYSLLLEVAGEATYTSELSKAAEELVIKHYPAPQQETVQS